MRFRTLGPLRVWAGDGWSALGAAHQRLLLAILLIEAGRVVSTARLVQEIWDDHPPRTAVHAVHVYVRRLRALLGEEILATRGKGYELTQADTDATAFERLVAGARQRSDPTAVVSQLSEGLALWRGAAFADVPQSPLVMAEAFRLDQARLTAIEDKLEAMLALGHNADVIDECQRLTAEYPLREKLHAHHMLALYRAGRRADALDAYQRARTALVDELGLEPGPHLREQHRSILNDEVALPVPSSATTHPRQLPPDVAGFTGRQEQLAQLDGLPSDVRIVAVTGGAGVGKSAFAVHWAHRVKDRFPDGQLHVNLRGYAAGSPLRPVDALAGFLRALGVAPNRIPADTDEATALYRSLLFGKRMLLLLDNAKHPDQLRPLLPGESSCFVLITSRDRLDGLAARDGAERLPLDPLPPDEAKTLLTRLLGARRVGDDPAATSRLAELCGHLPLALRIAAAQLANVPDRTIAQLAAHLASSNRLAALEVEGDPAAGVRPAFGQSYRVLRPHAQRVFRLFGVVSGPDLAATSVAVMAGIGDTDTASLLAELRAAHLLDETAPGRYALHDLLRLYAAEQASNEERQAALKRLYDFYLHSIDAASRLLYPHAARLPGPGGTAIRFDDHRLALRWLDEERANLVAAVLDAAGPVAWRLADALRTYLHLSMSYLDWERVADAGLAAAVAEGNIPGQAAAELSLGLLYVVQDRHPLAIDHCTRALTLARKANWPEAEAYALNTLAAVHWARGRLEDAADHLIRSLEIDRRLGEVATPGAKLTNLGIIYAVLGRLDQARAHLADALNLDRESGSVSGGARTLANLAEVHQLLGDFDKAHLMLERSRVLHEKVGDRNASATTTRALAALYRDIGSYDEALTAAHTALTVSRQTGSQRLEGNALATLGSVWHRIGKHRRAIDLYRRALELADSIGERYLKTEVLIGLALAGDRAAASEALELARRCGYRLLEGNALLAQADLHLRAGNRGLAAEAARRALAIHTETGHRAGYTRAEELLAQVGARPRDTVDCGAE